MMGRAIQFIKGKNYEILVSILVLVFLCYTLSGITNPPSAGHEGYDLGETTQFATNYLKVGYLKTRLGQLQNVGWSLETPGPYEYYVHHPVLVSILVSFSFLIFGVHEWSARIVPLLFNLATIILLYLYSKTYWSRRTGFFAVFFLVLSPMFYYIRNFVVWNTTTLTFIHLVLFIYVLWLNSRIKLRYFFLSFFVGTLTDWQIYFVIPPLLVHYILFVKLRRGWHFFLVVPIAALAFGLFLAHVFILTGSPAGTDRGMSPSSLYNTLLFRLNIHKDFHIEDLTYAKLCEYVKGNYIKYYTIVLFYTPIVFLAGLAAKFVLTRDLKSVEHDSLPMLVFASYVSWLFIFSNLTRVHDYQVYSVLPAIPVISALSVGYLSSVVHLLARRAESFGWVIMPQAIKLVHMMAVLAILLLFVYYSYKTCVEIYSSTQPEPIVKFLQSIKNENLVVNYLERGVYFQARFYYDQVKVKDIESYDQFDTFMNTTNRNLEYRYFIERESTDPRLTAYLKENYLCTTVPMNRQTDYVIYDLKSRKA